VEEFPVLHPLEEELEGAPAYLALGDLVGREGRLRDGAEIDVVEAHDRHVLRHPAARLLERLHRAQGDDVVHADEGGGQGAPLAEEGAHILVGAVVGRIHGDARRSGHGAPGQGGVGFREGEFPEPEVGRGDLADDEAEVAMS
jgi:hypothetical protein